MKNIKLLALVIIGWVAFFILNATIFGNDATGPLLLGAVGGGVTYYLWGKYSK